MLDISSHISGGGPCVGHFPALAILCEMHALLWLLVNVYLHLYQDSGLYAGKFPVLASGSIVNVQEGF